MLTLRNRSIGDGRATVKAVAAISSGNRIPGATSATTGISFVMIECYGDFTPTVLQRCKLRANGGQENYGILGLRRQEKRASSVACFVRLLDSVRSPFRVR